MAAEEKGGSVVEGASEMPPLNIKAVLVGATGAIGECLLGELLRSKNFAQVVVLGRRNAPVPAQYEIDQAAEESSGRLVQQVVDFETLSSENAGSYFSDKDVFFCALGTTRKTAGSAQAFRHIDFDYVVKCAEIAKEKGVSQMSYVSSQGANPNSWLLYTKTKGEVEEALKGMDFSYTRIHRPGVLDRGEKSTTVEKVAGWFMSPLPVSKVAMAMRIDAENIVKSQSQPDKSDADKSPTFRLLANAEIYKLCVTE